MAIAYKWTTVAEVEAVFLEGKKVGEIKKVVGGWQYFPKGSKQGGDIFKKISECEDSLKN